MERDNKHDFYKGLLMWGVVWGHCITVLLNGAENNIGIHLILRTYDMPFFMLISGFFFAFSIKKYTLKDLLKNKITTILLPTFFWGLLNSRFSNIGQNAFYFLYAVFFSSAILAIIVKLLRIQVLQYCSIVSTIFLLHIQPYSLWNLPYLFPYFVLGYYGFIIKTNYNMPLAITVFVICLCFWNSSYTVWNAGSNILLGGGICRILILRTVVAISGIIVVREIMDILYKYLSQNYKSIFDFILLCGKNTLALYILHSILLTQLFSRIVRLICKCFNFNPFNYNELLCGYVLAPWISIILMWGLVRFICLCKKYKYTEKLFGFKF